MNGRPVGRPIAALAGLVLATASALAGGKLEVSRVSGGASTPATVYPGPTPAPTPAPVPPQALPPSHAAYLKLGAASFELPNREIKETDFQLDLLGAGPTTLSSWRGELILLNFWATWCPSCREEIPSMQRLYARLASRGLTIVAVDLSETRDVVKRFVAQNKMTYPVLLDTSGSIGALYEAQSLPTTYVIDRTGTVLARTVGSRTWDSPEMVSLLESLLAG